MPEARPLDLGTVVATAVGPIDGGADSSPRLRSSGRLRRIIIVGGKLTIGFVISTIAVPALILSVAIASAVVATTGVTRLFRWLTRRWPK